jgi:hypothetical protein
MSRWAGRAAAAFAVWLGAGLAAWLIGAEPHPGLLALVVAVLAAALWLLLDLSGSSEPVRWPMPAEAPVRAPGEDPRLERLHRMLVQHQAAHDVGEALHRELARLADQRLLLHHGVTREAVPERAVELLGPELSRVLAQRPPYPRLTTAQVDVLLQRIEEL